MITYEIYSDGEFYTTVSAENLIKAEEKAIGLLLGHHGNADETRKNRALLRAELRRGE